MVKVLSVAFLSTDLKAWYLEDDGSVFSDPVIGYAIVCSDDAGLDPNDTWATPVTEAPSGDGSHGYLDLPKESDTSNFIGFHRTETAARQAVAR